MFAAVGFLLEDSEVVFFFVRSAEPFLCVVLGIDFGSSAAIATLLFKTIFYPLAGLSPDTDDCFIDAFDLTDSTFILEGLIRPVIDLPDGKGKPVKFLIDVTFFFFFAAFIKRVGFFVARMLRLFF